MIPIFALFTAIDTDGEVFDIAINVALIVAVRNNDDKLPTCDIQTYEDEQRHYTVKGTFAEVGAKIAAATKNAQTSYGENVQAGIRKGMGPRVNEGQTR